MLTDPYTSYVSSNENKDENNRYNGALTYDPAPFYFVAPVFDLHALTFNTAESMMSASLLPRPGYFDYNITAEQLSIMFHGLSTILNADENIFCQSFGAVAFYRPDGSLEFASVSESVIP